jgi:hypothetical protein
MQRTANPLDVSGMKPNPFSEPARHVVLIEHLSQFVEMHDLRQHQKHHHATIDIDARQALIQRACHARLGRVIEWPRVSQKSFYRVALTCRSDTGKPSPSFCGEISRYSLNKIATITNVNQFDYPSVTIELAVHEYCSIEKTTISRSANFPLQDSMDYNRRQYSKSSPSMQK